MTCMDFVGGLVSEGQQDPTEEQIQAFIKEKADVQMPSGVKSWKQNVKVRLEGSRAIKTVTRTCVMKDGSEQVIT